ncbi:MAG: hypothetical protein HY072_05910, partial [Deltaproteobacteria bacterium]|nr:hypothetical protein [Deltaproteobacteria bacterium]
MSEPKQTDTTQRWKISMRVSGNSIAIPTKIEFSRRSANGTALFEAIDPELTQNYKLYPIYTNHYDRQTAIQQKILALALRAATQARDVFDLEQLVSPYINMAQSNVSNKNILLAQENAMSINYGDFKSQVVAYLLLEYQLLYTKERWEKLLEKVVEYLERLKP